MQSEKETFLLFCSDLFKRYYTQEDPVFLDIFKKKDLAPAYWVANAKMWFNTELFLLLNKTYQESKALISKKNVEFFRKDFLIKLIEALKKEMQSDIDDIRNRRARWENIGPPHGLYNPAKDLQLLEDAWGIDYYKLHTDHVKVWQDILTIGIEETANVDDIKDICDMLCYSLGKLSIDLENSTHFEEATFLCCALLGYLLDTLSKKETEDAK